MALGRPIHGIGRMALNDAKIKAARPREKAYKLGDSNQLYLHVSPTGTRSFRMNYAYGRNAKGQPKQKTLTFGCYPSMTLAEARAERDAAKVLLRQGKDPAVERKTARIESAAVAANTFEAVARRWHEKQRPRWSKKHATDVIESLERDVFPDIGALPISAIKAPKLLEVLSAVEGRGSIETAHRIRSRCSAVFTFGIAAGLCDSDPAATLGKALAPKPRSNKQPAVTTLSELQQVLVACEAERCRAVTKLALRLLALTAVRPGELRFARWSEFEGIEWTSAEDAPDALWRIPAERMKGDENRKADILGEHLVPLAPPAVDVLRVLWRLTGDLELVFPGERNPRRPISENTLNALLKRAGYHERHVPHGFRAAFSTIMNERVERQWRKGGHSGASPDRAIIDLMLAHVPAGASGSESSYNRAAYMPRRRELAEEWADLLVGDFWPPEIHLGQPIRYAATGPGRPRPASTAVPFPAPAGR